MSKSFPILSFLFLGISSIAFSQIQEEKLVLDRKRIPEIKAIEKKKTSVERIKDYPPEEKRQIPVDYQITNVEAVSDFKTSTIQGHDIAPKLEQNHHKNYFRLGYGNYSQFLADGTLTAKLNNGLEVGTHMHVYSTKGFKGDYLWNSAAADTNVNAFVNAYGEKGKLNLTAEYALQGINYYGIYALSPQSSVDLGQRTHKISINGYYDFYTNKYLNDLRLKSSFLLDGFYSSENKFSAETNLSKHDLEMPWEQGQLNVDLGLGMNAQSSEFSLIQENKSNFFHMNVEPKISFFKGKSYFSLGSSFSILNHRNINKQLSEKENKVYWFPQAEALISVADEFKFYAGVDGGVAINSYTEMLKDNPFLLSDQELKPTTTQYNIYFGMKGDLLQNLKYDFSAGYTKLKNIMFYKANPIFSDDFTLQRRAYDFANTFSAAYDDGNLSTIKASIHYFPIQNLALDTELVFTKYQLHRYEHIYNVPLFTVSIAGKYLLLDKKLHLATQIFIKSDRTTNLFDIDEFIGADGVVRYRYTEHKNRKVGGYGDVNFSAEYKIHKNFSIFALGNNLLAAKYELYKGYKVLGAQVLGGIKITF